MYRLVKQMCQILTIQICGRHKSTDMTFELSFIDLMIINNRDDIDGRPTIFQPEFRWSDQFPIIAIFANLLQ